MGKFIDITGMVFGNLKVIKRAASNKHKQIEWVCECQCDKRTILTVSGSHIKSGHTRSCGCLRKEIAKDRCLDLTGKIFGLLKVIYKLDKEDVSRPYWMCECECGSLKVHTSSSLNNTLSCGCLGRKLTTERSTKHGMAHTRLYKIYKGMKKRCYSENAQNYKHYGGRGIILSSDWLGDEGFTNFKDWSLENGYTDELTIERIDVNGNYEPNNCCWIPKKEQFRNKTNTIRINIYNSQYSLDDLHKATNIPYQTLYTKTKHQSYSETKLIEYLETRTKMKIQEILKGIKNEL